MISADQGQTGALPESAPVALAANDDRGPLRAAIHEAATTATHSGWDAFEVWRSRVRDPRRAAAQSNAFPAAE